MSPIFGVMATILETETVVRKSFSKWVFLKFSQYLQENNCVGVSFLKKLQTFRPATLLKRDFNTGVFKRVWRSF